MIVPAFIKKLDPKIDYAGQELSRKLMHIILLVGYGLALLVGILLRDLTFTLVLGIATVVFAFLATVPAWPYFRMNPMKFKKESKTKRD